MAQRRGAADSGAALPSWCVATRGLLARRLPAETTAGPLLQPTSVPPLPLVPPHRQPAALPGFLTPSVVDPAACRSTRAAVYRGGVEERPVLWEWRTCCAWSSCAGVGLYSGGRYTLEGFSTHPSRRAGQVTLCWA